MCLTGEGSLGVKGGGAKGFEEEFLKHLRVVEFFINFINFSLLINNFGEINLRIMAQRINRKFLLDDFINEKCELAPVK